MLDTADNMQRTAKYDVADLLHAFMLAQQVRTKRLYADM